MIERQLSPVVPRVFSPSSGEVLQLADEIELLLERAMPVKVRLDGEGNVAALSHLNAVMAAQVTSGQLRLESRKLSLGPCNPIVSICADPSYQFLFPAGKQIHESQFDIILRLAPWGQDDLIEYLLAKHPKQCASVMSRLEHADVGFADGSPILWAMVLDRMAGNESKTDVEAIVLDEIDLRINNPSIAAAIADRMIFPAEPDRVGVLGHATLGADENILFHGAHSAAAEFLSHESVKFAFAIRRIVQRLRDGDNNEVRLLLRHRIRTMALMRLASEILGDTQTHAKLALLFKRNRRWEATNSATLLALSDPNWRPRGKDLDLYEACFDEVVWPDVKLQGADLRQATLAGADLSGADLRDCKLSGANFSGAKLIGADFHKPKRISLPFNTQVVVAAPITSSDDEAAAEPVEGKKRRQGRRRKLLQARKQRQRKMDRREKRRNHDAETADAARQTDRDRMGAFNQFQRVSFRGCDLSQAHLSSCIFIETDFRSADLSKAFVNESVFMNAKMDGAVLIDANFSRCAFQSINLSRAAIDRCDFSRGKFSRVGFEGVEADKVDFTKTSLGAGTWSGSKLTHCSFYEAGLSGSRIADICWEHCDLREADLRGCTFHMGSTRSGIVDSPYPSHGTRTGYYTDDYNDQHFQAPESIRKASLYGCDLRGANIHGVDFYLVDLRAAKFDDSQREQLVSTGAILDQGSL